MNENVDEILSACIDRLIAGASLEDVLAGQPEQLAATLGPALRDAQALLRSNVPVSPENAAREAARERMLTQLDAARAKANEFQDAPAVAGVETAVAHAQREARPAWLAAFMRRPASFRAAAVAGSVAVFGVLGVGAAAATGNAPEPVRELFRSSATSGLRIEFDGVIIAADPVAATFIVQVGDDRRFVQVVDATELSRGGDAIAFGDFAVGNFVEVKGTLQPDDAIIASRVHLDGGDDDDDDRTAEPEATAAPDDDDDDQDDDNSGPGNADDNGDDQDDDSSGPGDGDSHVGEDNSGPGNGDDDDAGNDGDGNSGPGGGNDEDSDDGDDD